MTHQAPTRFRPARPVRSGRHHRRGIVVVKVAVCLFVLIGFVALTVDVGHMYRTRTELQRMADACSLAATMELIEPGNDDPLAAARQMAQDYAKNNQVLQGAVELTAQDVIFGQARLVDATGKYLFMETENSPNAVRVRVRRTSSSPTGPVSLYFAAVLGFPTANITAQATAVAKPRDIVFVLDLSASHNDDSSLRSLNKPGLNEVANRGVWDHLGDESGTPRIGNLRNWGDGVTNASWDFRNDPGLVKLEEDLNFSLDSVWMSQTLMEKGFDPYTSGEADVINNISNSGESLTKWRTRALVALGVYRWKSGKPGGQPGGDGDDEFDPGELELMVEYPSAEVNPDTNLKRVGGDWDSFMNYVANKPDPARLAKKSAMCKETSPYYGNADLAYRFGFKTFVDYLQEGDTTTGDDASPGLGGAPQEPARSVLNAVAETLTLLEELNDDDQAGLASFGKYGYGPEEKPDHMSWLRRMGDFTEVAKLTEKLGQLQAPMWTDGTNIAQGIERGVDVLLDSEYAREHAARVMIVVTDGKALYGWNPDVDGARPDLAEEQAIESADAARVKKIQIYGISVGAESDQDAVKRIAEEDYPDKPAKRHFHAEGDVADYREKLLDILREIGGSRPVILID